jgi:hypothetical protein
MLQALQAAMPAAAAAVGVQAQHSAVTAQPLPACNCPTVEAWAARCVAEAAAEADAALTALSLGELEQPSDQAAPAAIGPAASVSHQPGHATAAAPTGQHVENPKQPLSQAAAAPTELTAGDLSQPLEEAVVLGLLCRDEANGFGYWDTSYARYACGLVPAASLFNHSCLPNVAKTTAPGFQVL